MNCKKQLQELWFGVYPVSLLNTSCVSKNQDNKLDWWKRFLSWNTLPFWLENPTPFMGRGGGGEGWVMKINFVLYFFRCCQALEAIYFLHDPKWFPPMPPPSYFVPQAGHLDLSLSSTVGICTNGIAPLWGICNLFQNNSNKCPELGTDGAIDISLLLW